MKERNLIRYPPEDAGEYAAGVPEGVDPELLGKVLADPEMAALLVSMASKMNSKV